MRLTGIRDALLHLHKALVEFERVRYEQTIGTIQSPNQFLHLLTTDPWFAWLHPISRLIVAMDEAIDGEMPVEAAGLSGFVDQARQLLVASEQGEGFSRHYFDALQEEPDVVLAHAATIKQIGRPPANDSGKAINPGGS